MQLQVLEILPNRALNCQLTLTRKEGTAHVAAGTSFDCGARNGYQTSINDGAASMHNATLAAAEGAPRHDAALSNPIYQTHTPCKLLCGCSNTDQLLLMRSVVLETFISPLQVSQSPLHTQGCMLHTIGASFECITAPIQINFKGTPPGPLQCI